jgi:thiamine-monophosphate kinase
MGNKRMRPGIGGGELEILQEIRQRAAQVRHGGGLRLAIGDDCALLVVRPGEEVAVTTDLSIAGRHFHLDWHPPESVGHRALARGLSDLAAMGARPLAAFLSLGVPRELTVAKGRGRAWLGRFFDGLLRLAEAHKTPLAGGDLAESPVALADIVLVGAVPAGQALRRSGARPGDQLYVTGRLGGAAAGLAKLASAAGRLRGVGDRARVPGALATHLYPEPRVLQGLALRRRGLATATIDLSDGPSTDLRHLCEESGVGAILMADKLPVAEEATLEQALHGGEDYELLFAAHPSVPMPRSIAGVAVTRIGSFTKRRLGQPLILVARGSTVAPLESRGWEHFGS